MYSSYDFVISDGVLTALHVGANSGGVLIIPEGVTTLTRNFLGGDSVRHSLTRVVLPDSLQKIEGWNVPRLFQPSVPQHYDRQWQ